MPHDALLRRCVLLYMRYVLHGVLRWGAAQAHRPGDRETKRGGMLRRVSKSVTLRHRITPTARPSAAAHAHLGALLLSGANSIVSMSKK